MRFVWGLLSSPVTSAGLGVVLAGLVAASVVLPQGWIAVELAGLESGEALRRAYVWGLTDVAGSPWLQGLMVLIGVNGLAAMLRAVLAREPELGDGPLPHRAALKARRPERAAEVLRLGFGRWLGRPLREEVMGAHVAMVFSTAPRSRYIPLVLHAGLVLLLVGAALAARPADRMDSLVKAQLVVRDADSRSLGFFDLAAGEGRSFFQNPETYTIAQFMPDRAGLGPALRMAVTGPTGQLLDDFWLYRDAPPGFDARHRRGRVAITATEMGYDAKPGHGVGSRPAGVVLLLGLGLLGLGLAELGRPSGRLVLRSEGGRVVVEGAAARPDDPRFAKLHQRGVELARRLLDAS